MDQNCQQMSSSTLKIADMGEKKVPTSFMDGPQEEDEKAAVSCFCG
jgi:hypothetical protein